MIARQPPTAKALAGLVVLLLAWAVIQAAAQEHVAIIEASRATPGPWEWRALRLYLLVSRWLPVASGPFLMAPMLAISSWLLISNRATWGAEPARSYLIWWLAVFSLTLAFMAMLPEPALRSMGYGGFGFAIVLMIVLSWSYGGAIFNALSLQQARYRAATSRVHPLVPAIGILVAQIVPDFAPSAQIGVGISVALATWFLWLVWASRLRVSEERAV